MGQFTPGTHFIVSAGQLIPGVHPGLVVVLSGQLNPCMQGGFLVVVSGQLTPGMHLGVVLVVSGQLYPCMQGGFLVVVSGQLTPGTHLGLVGMVVLCVEAPGQLRPGLQPASHGFSHLPVLEL